MYICLPPRPNLQIYLYILIDLCIDLSDPDRFYERGHSHPRSFLKAEFDCVHHLGVWNQTVGGYEEHLLVKPLGRYQH